MRPALAFIALLLALWLAGCTTFGSGESRPAPLLSRGRREASEEVPDWVTHGLRGLQAYFGHPF